MVGLAGAQAIHDGALDPAAPLSDYLSLDVAWPDGVARSFTHLATHTSGILDTDAGYEEVGYHFGATTHPMSLEGFLSAYLTEGGGLYDADANFGEGPPGSRYDYSNIATGLAGQAIGDAVGEDFAAYSARVLAPLALSAGWGHLGPAPDGAATLYSRDEAGDLEALPPYGLATWPDGQFNASARDLAKLLATVMGGGRYEGVPLIAPEVIALLTSPRAAGLDGMDDDDEVGLFWSTETLSYGIWRLHLEGHSGGDPGVFTMMYRTAGTDTGFVLMLNGEPEGLFALIRLARIATLLSEMPEGP